MKTKIKKGDKVKIKTSGEIYTTFEKMFIELGFKNTKINSLTENCKDLIWEVISIKKHPYSEANLAFIKSNDKELLIGIIGLELIPSYQLTKEQIIAIAENGSLVKELFSDVFEVELEVGKWYKFKSGTLGFYQGENVITYGVHIGGNEFIANNEWFFDQEIKKVERLATPKEVETAFKNYFVEKGFVNGVKVKCLNEKRTYVFDLGYKTVFEFEDNTFYMGGVCLFKDGEIATIIQTPNDVIKVIETYGKDKLITLIEAYDNSNSK